MLVHAIVANENLQRRLPNITRPDLRCAVQPLFYACPSCNVGGRLHAVCNAACSVHKASDRSEYVGRACNL